MTPNRHRNAWIWVAFAAIALATVARAESGLQSARSYAHPVLEFFSGNQAGHAADLSGGIHSSSRQLRHASRSEFAGAWLAMLPVFFVGLVSPLNQRVAQSLLCFRAPSAPLLPASFQRPPPQF